MCGIIGQINVQGQQDFSLSLKKLHHRGPDGSGEWKNVSGNVYLGHTRLAILEPTPAGSQPMGDASQKFNITFNGEIYNHLKLRKLLPDINWRGNSDTETLLELLAVKGLEALPLLKGMFAFALYNSEDNSVLLVRDRLGIKPLWIKFSDKSIAFASEVRALLPPGKVDLNQRTLSEYLSFGHFSNNCEIVDGLFSIPPAGWMKIAADGNILKGNWWPVKKISTSEKSGKENYKNRVNILVTKSIEEHLISDVGIGAFLSGGIDSSIITMVAGKRLGKELKTFTIGFPQAAYDERKIAREVAMQAGSDHYELEISEFDCVDWVKEAVQNLDLPSVDAINTYIVAKAVRKTGLKVALSGLGGDEIFGGYPSFSKVPSLKILNRLPPTLREKLIEILPEKIKQKIGGTTDFSAKDLTVASRRFTSVADLKSMGFENGIPFIPEIPEGMDKMGKISWAEIYGYMIPMLLRDSDQMSMAVGLEIRVPFLDHMLVEEVLSMSQKYKKGFGAKPLLVEAFKIDLPGQVYNRPKQGFSLPMAEWILADLEPFTRQGIQYVSEELELNEPIDQFMKFQRGELHWTRIWHWCVLGHWLVQQKERSGAGGPEIMSSIK